MSGGSFLDANVLAYTDDSRVPQKQVAAIDLHAAHQLSFWDALLVQAATRSGCSVLFTEDLQHGQRFAELEVINPFL